MPEKRHFLMVPFAYGGAHVVRLICLGTHLRAAGHAVDFACADPAARAAQAAGFRVLHLPEVSPDAWQEARAGGCLQLHDESTLHEHVRQEAEVIRQVRPDVVVGAGRLTLPVAAHVARTRYAQVLRVEHSPVRAVLPAVPPTHRKVVAGSDVTDSLPVIFRARMVRRLLRAWAEPYNRCRKRFGMPPVSSILEVGTGTLNLLADLPQLVPAADLPESFRWAGPLIPSANADAPTPEWMASFLPERPVVIVSLERYGSVELLVETIRHFISSAFQVVVVLGGLLKPEQMGGVVPNLTPVVALPPGDQLWRAAGALVFDGYAPLMYRALEYGVPMVALPLHREVAEDLRLLSATSAGVVLGDGAGRVVRTTELVVSRMGYRDAAERLGAAIGEYPAARAAKMLVEFAETGKLPQTA